MVASMVGEHSAAKLLSSCLGDTTLPWLAAAQLDVMLTAP
jgi:hypothetical protein